MQIGKALSNHENEKILMIFGMLKHDLNLPEFRYISIFPSLSSFDISEESRNFRGPIRSTLSN